ncbi:unnamed protein product [Rodentolepis nana]|uniref:TLDc domain-containing protein n=1 Tax=Rodentolepis nana TaxID=102285 RepID=A0A0R3TQ86_RODNA|nr:unnamed protein product [Rodentolepis nana]
METIDFKRALRISESHNELGCIAGICFAISHSSLIFQNGYKYLLGGDRFEIDVKFSSRRFLSRIPVIGTTNEDLGALLTSIDHPGTPRLHFMEQERRSEEVSASSSRTELERSRSPSFIELDSLYLEEGQRLFSSAQRLNELEAHTEVALFDGMAFPWHEFQFLLGDTISR